MQPLEELLLKLADGEKLTPMEREELRLIGREVDRARMTALSWLGSDSRIKDSAINFPFAPLYSTVLEANTASITVQIPSLYKHLFLMGSGELTAGGFSYIFGRFNGDSSAVYHQQKIYNDTDVTVVGEYNASQTGALVGIVEAGSSFVSFIPHCHSNTHKNSLLLAHYNGSLIYTGSIWEDTDPITSITFLPTSSSFKLGFALTVYGVQ